MSGAMLTPVPIVTKFGLNIIRVLGCNPGPMTLQGTNTYLIGKGKRKILIDTGETNRPDYIMHLKQVLHDQKATLSDIILTHWHHDHIGGVRDVLQSIENGNDCRIWKYRRTEVIDEYPNLLNGIKLNFLQNRQTFQIDGVPAMHVIHTAGHTTDHVVVILNETKEMFSGDCVLGDGSTTVFEDLYTYMESLQTIIDLDPSVIYPGHGNVIQNPKQTIQYYIDHRNQREQQILNELRLNPDTWLSATDIVKKIYADKSQDLWKAATCNVLQHLEKLKKMELIQSDQLKSGIEQNVWKIKNKTV